MWTGCFFAFGQNYWQDRVVVKVKSIYANDFRYFRDFQDIVEEFSIDTIIQKFPHSSRKKCLYDNKCVDLTTIYELRHPASVNQKIFLRKLRNTGYFHYAESMPIARLAYVPNDSLISSQNHLAIVKAYDAWNISKSTPFVTIGIVDSGIDFLHEDLYEKIAYNTNDPVDGTDNDGDGYTDNYYGWNFTANSPNVKDDINHGVHVAGIAAADTDNGKGVAGVGFHAKILPVKV
ncbi:MAG: hypothetical protein D6707_10790, partial [Bacteroidetes bacterium]